MSKRIAISNAVLCGVVAVVLLSPLVTTSPAERQQERGQLVYEQERARLERHLAHAATGSVEEFKAQRNLQRLEAAREGRPRMENPDQFARILYEMRVRGGKGVPDYEPGYAHAELAKAMKSRAAKVPLPWQSRGPGNVAGRARGLIVDPDDLTRQTWWVGSVGGGIWKTTDAGATWTDVAPALPNLPISWLVMAESDHDILYAGTGESFFNIDTINGNGILKSIDHGQTWTPLPSTLDDPDFNNISRIIVDPTDPDVVIASTTTGRYKDALNGESHIFKSTDGGTSWTSVYTETDLDTFGRTKRVTQVVATVGNFDVQYAAIDEKGILKSTDAGDTWTLINNGLTDTIGRFELAVSPHDPDLIWASAEGTSFSNLWYTANAGATWVQTFEMSGSEPNWLGAQGWYDNTIVCDPDDANRVYVGGIRLWQIDLQGDNVHRSTSLLSTGSLHVDHHNLVAFDDPSAGSWRILNANDGGIGVSALEAASWSDPDDGMITGQFYGVDKRPGASAYVGGMQDNGTWFSPVDPSATDFWTFSIGGDGYETSWHFDDPSKIIGGYQFNGLQRSLDGGLSWSSATSGLADVGGASAPFITKIAKSNLEPDLLFAVGLQGVWRSTDFGGSWSLTPISPPDWPATMSSFTDVRISRADPDVVWTGARMDGSGTILVSTDRGLTFDPTTIYPGMGGISGLATHPTDPNTAYVLFSFAEAPKILRTTDLGATWTDITGFAGGGPSTNGFPDVAVYDLIVLPHDTDTIWAGTEIGLVESTDGGVTWALANNGFPNIPIWFLTHVEDEVVVATHGRGVWSVTMDELTLGQTYKPLLEKVVQGPDGLLTIIVNRRSPYDATQVFVDGNLLQTLPANATQDEVTVTMPVTVAATVDVQAIGTKSAVPYPSVIKSVDVVPLKALRFAYENDFDAFSDDFVLDGFSIGSAAGFSSNALQSAHFYPDGQTAIAMLAVPIAVSTSNAIVSFDEVVVVEPGDPGTVFGDFAFWDYVIVEGTNDGCVWVPLADGYDARLDPAWETAFNFGQPGTSSMLRNHQFDLLDVFSPGDHVLIRFRLYADAFVNGWGWLIDNVQIQAGSTAVESDTPVRFALEQNAPNPFNPRTQIRYTLPVSAKVELTIYDARGREVRTLVRESQLAGPHQVVWDGTDDRGGQVASGVYLYRISAGEFVEQRKMTLLR